LIGALVTTSACAPAFSDARMLRPGQVEITPAVNAVGITENGDSTHTYNEYGARLLFGVGPRVNVGVGYARSDVLEKFGLGDFGFNTLAFGPKFSLVPDRIAVAMPVGFSFGEEMSVSDTFQIHPTLLMTVPLGEHVDFNPAVRLLVPTCDNCDTLIAFHAGFGLRTGRRVVVRPEVAFVVDPGEDGVLWTLGVGVSLRSVK
jgi:hypothetical protein